MEGPSNDKIKQNLPNVFPMKPKHDASERLLTKKCCIATCDTIAILVEHTPEENNEYFSACYLVQNI